MQMAWISARQPLIDDGDGEMLSRRRAASPAPEAPVMTMTSSLNAKTLIAAAAVAALLLPIGSAGESPAANKAAAAGSDFVHLGTADSPLGPTTILATEIKAGGPQDVVIQVALECSLLTDVYSTTLDDHPEGYTAIGRAEAHVDIQVLLDGAPVTLNGEDDGSVTFCDRVHQQEIRDIDEDTGNFTIRQFQQTMSANAFNWVALDLGSGLHTIEVVATIVAANTEGSFAQGAIEKRTLIVEPVDFAHGATLDSDPNEGTATSQASADQSAASADELPADESLLSEFFGFLS